LYVCQTKLLLIKNKKVKDNTSKKKFNRNSITVNVDSKYSVNAFNKFVYDAKQTELIHDALQVLLNSPNPLRKEYGFTDRDLKGLSELRKKQIGLIRETKEFLSMCKTIKEEKNNKELQKALDFLHRT
jgi:hypothetical protein